MFRRNHPTNRIVLFVTLALTFAVVTLAPISKANAQGEPFMELMRQDIQADKIALMTVAMELTEEQGEVFWPIYREYQTELSKLGDRKIVLIKDYAKNFDAMTEDKAKDLAKESFKIQEKQFSLLKKTHKKIGKEIGYIVATRFSQAESQMQNLISLQIAAELPLIK